MAEDENWDDIDEDLETTSVKLKQLPAAAIKLRGSVGIDIEDGDWDDQVETSAYPTKSVSKTSKVLCDSTLVSSTKDIEDYLRLESGDLQGLTRFLQVSGLGLETSEQASTCGIRGKVWKIVLRVQTVSAKEYASFISMKQSKVHDKITKDTPRTFKGDKKFHDKVSETQLVRLLNAFAWKMHERDLNGMKFSYVQGMNVLAGIFLYVMPELDAFYTFSLFVETICPTYVQPNLEGVHRALGLFGELLEIVDKDLSTHLKSKNVTPILYAFAPLLTFGAATSPLDEAITLWDFLVLNGFHLNIVLVLSQVLLMRTELLASDSPMKLLRTLPDLDAVKIIQQAHSVMELADIPSELWSDIRAHGQK